MKKRNQKEVDTILLAARKEIDALDDQILKLLARRYRVVDKVSRIKLKYGIPVYQWKRVKAVKDRNVKTAKKYGVDAELVRMIWTLIISRAHDMEDMAIRAEERKKQRKK